jgi:NAD(P)-dependent dehydrogenase (short-subunit alcohol dehydrogenase family)
MAAAVKISTLVNILVHTMLVLMIFCVSLLLQSMEAAAHGTRVNAIAPGNQHTLLKTGCSKAYTDEVYMTQLQLTTLHSISS